MATTYTQADITRLKAIRAQGTGRITVGGKTVEYRSLEEIDKAITSIAAELNREAGIAPVRQVRLVSNRGLG